jgi:hypothetical protein
MVSAVQQPNMFVLSGRGVHVSYSSQSIGGGATLTYQDTQTGRTFSGTEIRTVTNEQSELETVSIRVSVDTGYTSFTLVVPRVNLEAGHAAHVDTVGVIGVHRATVDTPTTGQLDTYRTVRLSGTASFVET